MEWIELGKLGEVLSGYAFKSKKYVNKGIRVIRITNVQNGYLEDDDPKYYSEEGIEGLERYLLLEDDILISLTGNVGRVAKLEKKFLPAALNQRVACVRANKRISDEYLYYMLNSSYFENRCISQSKGVAQKNLGITNLKNIKIPVPPMEIQEKIVKVLDQAQALIDKRKEQIEALDQLIESIFYTVFGDPVRNEKGWEVKEIQDLGKVGSSRRVYLSECVDDGIPFYRGQEVSRLSHGKDPNNELFITSEHYETLKAQRGIPKEGDLLLPSICPDGDIWMVDTDEPFYFKDGRVLWVELDDENINNFFVKSTLAHILRRNFKGISSGSTFSELKIFLLEKITIPIPPLLLQNEFAKKVEIIEKQKELLEESLKLLEENYKSIMDKAFKGQLFN